MKRVLVSLLLMSLVLTLVGCSSNNVPVSWNNGVLSGPNGTMDLQTYEGYKGYQEYAGLNMNFYTCESREECPHNNLGVEADSMTKYKDAYYYVGYLGTQMWMFVKNSNGGWIECNVSISNSCVLSTDAIAEVVYNRMKTLTFSETIDKIVINDCLALKTADYDFKVRQADVIIPGAVRVKIDDGTITTTGSEMIGSVMMGKYVTEVYTYYTYNGLIIQIANGLSIDSYIEVLQ